MSTYGHGPTVREQQVIDLRESGMQPGEIAQATGLSEGYVQQVLSNLLAPKPVDWQSPARRGSSDLLSALRRHFPQRCGGVQ